MNAELERTVQTLVSCDEIQTFADDKYTDDVRACIYELHSLNVGVQMCPGEHCSQEASAFT